MADDDEPGARRARPSYAVLWQHNGEEAASGGLQWDRHGLRFTGRHGSFHVPFTHVRDLSIQRGAVDRVRGLPVIRLLLAEGTTLRIASLEGIGALHELAGALQQRTTSAS